MNPRGLFRRRQRQGFDFRSRRHQLPRLLKLWKNRQGHPLIAAFVVLNREMKQPIKRGWLIPVQYFENQDTFRLNDLIAHERNWGLVWVPKIGWTNSMMRPPDPARLQEDE